MTHTQPQTSTDSEDSSCPPPSSELSIEDAGRVNAGVLVCDDGVVIDGVTLDVATGLGELSDAVAAPMVVEDLSSAHGRSWKAFFG